MKTPILSLLPLLVFASVASAQGFTKLEVVRTDASRDDAEGRRKLTLTVRGDWQVSYSATFTKEGDPTQWRATPNVQGTTAISRHARRDAFAKLVADALASSPTGDLSGSLPAEKRATLQRWEVAIDAVSFELHGSEYAKPEQATAIQPLLAALNEMLEAHLPPPSLYAKITYSRSGATLELSPTGTVTLTRGQDVAFDDLSRGPLNKVQALIKQAGVFTPENQGKTVALQARSGAAGAAFELELEPLKRGASTKLTGTVGSYAAVHKNAGALVDYLESTLARLAKANPVAGSGGMGGALEPQ